MNRLELIDVSCFFKKLLCESLVQPNFAKQKIFDWKFNGKNIADAWIQTQVQVTGIVCVAILNPFLIH